MTDGWAYFCTDTGSFYIDYSDVFGALRRAQINADFAGGLRYLVDNEYVELSAEQIAEYISKTGDLSELATSDRSTVGAAINELASQIVDFTTSKIYFNSAEPESWTTNDLWVELIT